MASIKLLTPKTRKFQVIDGEAEPSHASPDKEYPGTGPTWLPELLGRLEVLMNLRQGWDGENGLPVIDDCADEALVILVMASERDTPKPHISPTPDGGISFEISKAGRELGLDVEHDLTLGILRKDADGSYTEKEVARDLMRMVARRELQWLMSGK